LVIGRVNGVATLHGENASVAAALPNASVRLLSLGYKISVSSRTSRRIQTTLRQESLLL